MIKKQLLSKILSRATFATVMLLSSSILFAQVKIGTAPTTIDANSNLEVQATNNKKVIVNKADGTVVIENTPPGALPDSIMTVDASGNVRAINKAMLKKKLGLSGSGSMVTGGTQSLTPGVRTTPDFTSTLLDEESSIDLANNLFTVKVAGIYTISSTVAVLIPGPAGQSANVTVWIQKNTSGAWVDIARNNLEQNSTFTNLVTVTMAEKLNIGDKIRVQVNTCTACITGTPNYTLTSASLFVSKTN